MRDFIRFDELIQQATGAQPPKPEGDLEWFQQVLAALNSGQIEDVRKALEQAIDHKRKNNS